MLDWTVVRPALVSLFETLTDGAQVVWHDQRQPFVDPVGQAIVRLRVFDQAGSGVDDRRYNDLNLAAPAATLEETANGHRRVVLEAKVESFDESDDRFAFNLADGIRTRIRFGSNLAALRAINFSLAKVERTQDIGGVEQDDRTVSVALVELVFNAGFTTTNEGEANRIYNIEQVDNPVDHLDTEFN